MRLLIFCKKVCGVIQSDTLCTTYLHNHDNQKDGYIISTFQIRRDDSQKSCAARIGISIAFWSNYLRVFEERTTLRKNQTSLIQLSEKWL